METDSYKVFHCQLEPKDAELRPRLAQEKDRVLRALFFTKSLNRSFVWLHCSFCLRRPFTALFVLACLLAFVGLRGWVARVWQHLFRNGFLWDSPAYSPLDVCFGVPFLSMLQGQSVSARTLLLLRPRVWPLLLGSVSFGMPLAELSAHCSVAWFGLGLQCARSCGNKTQGSSVVCSRLERRPELCL